MDFESWEPIYERILRDFGYDRGADIRARDVLAGYVRPFDLSRLDVSGKTVAVAGGSPRLTEELGTVEAADAVFAASTAADVLEDAGLDVDVLITDLDKNPETAIAFSRRGRPVVVHAHGDNIRAIRRHLPDFDVEHVLGTTQAAPAHPVRNFGGFTDGDRAAFLADHLGGGSLTFPGWDFDDEAVSDEKAMKLAWAERLLLLLEERRGETFDILEGRGSELTVDLG
ncbi:MAG: 6-hydroxymethylpterin diphosphokinase MptE-like protein [Halodesulfurarchaeum sp.]